MAGLLCTLFIFSLAHLALADWSWENDDNRYSKKYGGYYNGRPRDDEDSGGWNSDSDDNQMKPYYTQPYYKPIPFKKPVYKPKSIYNPKPVLSPQMSPEPPVDRRPMYKPPQEEPPIYKPRHGAPPISKPPQGTPPTLPSPSQPDTPSYTPSSSLQKQWLDPHNAARAERGLPPMVWSDKVAQYAESWANQRKASGCGLQHSNGPYGENIFWGSGGGYGPAECVAAWVSEKQYYNYADNSCASGQQCGHYTQIVWATSVNLGCAKVQCDSGQIFMTCNYDPPGNWIGSKPY